MRSSVTEIDFDKIKIGFNHTSNHTEYAAENRYDKYGKYHHCLEVHPYTILKQLFQLSSSALKVYYRNEPAATVTIGSISLHVPSESFYTPSPFHPATSKYTDNSGTGYLCLDIEYGKSLLSQKQVYDRNHTISSKTKMKQQYRHLCGRLERIMALSLLIVL